MTDAQEIRTHYANSRVDRGPVSTGTPTTRQIAEAEFDRWLSNHVAAELDRLADKMLDPVEGLPFDDDYDLAIVAAWVSERAEEMRK